MIAAWALVELARQLAFIGRARAAGQPIVAGTDTPNPFIPPGRSLHRELELLVDSGLSPIEALRAATLRAAELLGIAAEHGPPPRPASGLTSSWSTGTRRRDIRATGSVRLVVQGGTDHP